MLSEGITGRLWEVGDVAGLASLLGESLAHPVQAREMGKAGREFARQRYSSGAIARRTVDVYLDVAVRSHNDDVY